MSDDIYSGMMTGEENMWTHRPTESKCIPQGVDTLSHWIHPEAEDVTPTPRQGIEGPTPWRHPTGISILTRHPKCVAKEIDLWGSLEAGT